MESVVDSAAVAACVMPRFEDGSTNLQELIRSLTEAVVNQIMDAEADQVYTEGSNSRNGYRERRLVTCVSSKHSRYRSQQTLVPRISFIWYRRI